MAFMTSTTVSTQIKLTLPFQLKSSVRAKADNLGLTIAAYIKHLVIADVKKPDLQMSDWAYKALHEAIKNEKEGKLIPIDDIDKYLDQL
jgi:hypothetical protein